MLSSCASCVTSSPAVERAVADVGGCVGRLSSVVDGRDAAVWRAAEADDERRTTLTTLISSSSWCRRRMRRDDDDVVDVTSTRRDELGMTNH